MAAGPNVGRFDEQFAFRGHTAATNQCLGKFLNRASTRRVCRIRPSWAPGAVVIDERLVGDNTFHRPTTVVRKERNAWVSRMTKVAIGENDFVVHEKSSVEVVPVEWSVARVNLRALPNP
jgi:hypothetical protein